MHRIATSAHPSRLGLWLLRARRAAALLLLAFCLNVAAPAPAHANLMWDLTTLGSTIAGWAAKLAKWAGNQARALMDQAADAVQISLPLVVEQLNSTINIALHQSTADAMRNATDAEAAGTASSEGVYSTQGQTCSLTHAGQEASVSAAVTRDAVSALLRISEARGSGKAADTSSPAYRAAEVNDLCKLGFLDNSGDGRYGDLPKTMGCTTNTDFIDADTKISSVIGRLQYPLPYYSSNATSSHVRILDGGQVSFAGSTATETAAGLGSELDFAAAYKYCEHLQPELSSPTVNAGTATIDDINSIIGDRKVASLRSAAAVECFRALAYRTSCRKDSADGLKNSDGTSCYDVQKQLCERLKSSRAAGGLEITMKGANPVYAAAIDNCETEGISQAMYDAIMAHRCQDRNYSFKVLPALMGNGPTLEFVRMFDCPNMEAAYNHRMNVSLAKFLSAVENLMSLQSQSHAGAAGTRVTK